MIKGCRDVPTCLSWLVCAILNAAPAGAATIDMSRAQAFLADVCSKAPGAEFATAWLAHEVKYWDFYGPVYYLGLRVLKELEKQIGSQTAVRMAPKDFSGRARSVLEQIAAPGKSK